MSKRIPKCLDEIVITPANPGATPDINVMREYLKYDPDTGDLVWRKRVARGIYAGVAAGKCRTKNGYFALTYGGRQFKTHRVAWALFYGQWPNGYIDHISGNKLDNRIINLREATPRQSSFNVINTRRKYSYPRGVLLDTHCKLKKPWGAMININGKNKRIGHFATMEEAAKAYLNAAASHQGEFAFHLSRSQQL